MGAEQAHEDEYVGDEQGRDDRGHEVEASTEGAGVQADVLAFITREEEVGRAPNIEYPHRRCGPGCRAR